MILDKSSMQTQRLYRRYLPIRSSNPIHWVFSLWVDTIWKAWSCYSLGNGHQARRRAGPGPGTPV